MSINADQMKRYAFDKWVDAFGIPYRGDGTDDYDMYGYFDNVYLQGDDQKAFNPMDGHMHYPDTYKLPNHDSFSMESQYWEPGMPGRVWAGNLLLDLDQGRIHRNDVRNMLERKFGSGL